MAKLRLALQEAKRLQISVERKTEIKQMDKWFYSLTTNSQADMACRLWENATYEQKAEEYYIS